MQKAGGGFGIVASVMAHTESGVVIDVSRSSLISIYLQDSHSPPDSPPRSAIFSQAHMLAESQPGFGGFSSLAGSAASLNHLSRAGASSMMEAVGGQKQSGSQEQQRLQAFTFANLPLLQQGGSMDASLTHSLLLSAQAAQNPSLVSPAYSALSQEQYRKNVAPSSSSPAMRSSFPTPNLPNNHDKPDPLAQPSSRNSDVRHRSASSSNSSALLNSF